MPDAATLPDALKDAIERLYAAFEKYPRPKRMNGDMTVFPKTHPFLTQPLRSLSIADFKSHHDYFSKAMLSVGSFDDFCYLLPRVMELVALESTRNQRESCLELDPEIVLGRLTYELGNCERRSLSHWRSSERDAILEYLSALWNWVLISPMPWEGSGEWATPYEVTLIDDWLGAVVGGGMPVEKCLESWRSKHAWPAVIRLSEQIGTNKRRLQPGAYRFGALLPADDSRHEFVREWLLSPATVEQLKDGQRRHPSAPGRHIVASAIETLEQFHS